MEVKTVCSQFNQRKRNLKLSFMNMIRRSREDFDSAYFRPFLFSQARVENRVITLYRLYIFSKWKVVGIAWTKSNR